MQPRPSFDRTLLTPIAIGVVSILGIGWLLLTSYLRETLVPPTAVPTVIPFDVNSLETEIESFYPSATSTQAETPPTAIETQPEAYPGPLPETLPPAASTLITESLLTPSATPTPDRIRPLVAGKYYDDTDLNIAYDSYWITLKNP